MQFAKPNKVISLRKMQRMTRKELIDHIAKFERLPYDGIFIDKLALMDILNFNLNRYLFAFYF